MPKNYQMMITKSEYMMFLKHPAWVWVKKHAKELLPLVDDSLQAIFDTGYLFEEYAEQQFKNVTRLGFNDYNEYMSLPARTMEALGGGAETIVQGRFEFGEFTFICDVVQVVEDKTIDLFEIKSSTRANEHHVLDLAFQKMVLEGLGYTVRNAAVIHVNNEYVREGEIDQKKICATTDVTEAVNALRETTIVNAAAALEAAKADTMPDPSPSHARLGSYREWLEVYRNIVDVPDFSIYDITRLSQAQAAKLEALGIKLIVDVPDDFALTDKQALQVEATKLDKPIIRPELIKEYLNGFEFPLYFLDYETYSGLLPYFDGQKPYQQVPFQYSLHILDSPGGELRHEEYLHKENTNPVEPLSEALRSQIGTSGTILTWNMGFEKSCNTRMGELSPEFAEFYAELNERIVDLMIPFSNGWFVHKDFKGSASIKKVLPVVVPSLSYSDLEVNEGSSAQRQWMNAVLDGKEVDDLPKLLSDLIEYCKLDTLAMVEIYRVLKTIQ